MTKDNISIEKPSLFDEAELQDSSISVVKASFLEPEKTQWKSLFDGFDELYAITYSSGVDFVTKIVSGFQYSEIVFGHEGVLGSDIATVMAASKQSVEKIARHKSAGTLAELMKEEKLALYVARDSKSHEKIYCMRAKDGRYRVLVGSANMSASAFTGLQRENIVLFDTEEAFDYYKKLFDEYKSECSDSVSYKVIGRIADDRDFLEDNPEEIPVIKTMEKRQTIILDPATDAEEEEIQFVADIKNVAEDLKPIIPRFKKQGRNVIITSAATHEVSRKLKTAFSEKKEQKKIFPKLHIDYENNHLMFNGEDISLHPDKNAVASDVSSVVNYLNSLSSFNNEWMAAQENYFKFMTWFFASAFMSRLRLTAYSTGYSLNLFPVVGILYGASNGGKSTFVRLLSKLMTGKNIHPNQSEDFTATKIDALRQSCEGVPIYIDDLAKQQYANHNEKIIKTDNWGIKERLENYPAIAISTNKLPSVTPDIYKRSITCRINVRISLTDGMNSSRKINETIKCASTALYGEYVCRMFPLIHQMEEEMKEGKENNPDIFKASSDTLLEIFKEYLGEPLPSYIKSLSYNDYFGSEEIGRDAKKKLLLAWESDPRSFKTQKRKNKLVYSFPDPAYHDIKYLIDELPPNLNCQVSGNSLTMDYSDAKEFFGCDFKRHLFK